MIHLPKGPGTVAAHATALVPSGVAFLDPEQHIYEAMVEGWKRQQTSRALRTDTIKGRLKIIERFHFFTNSYPWQWTAGDFVEFSNHLMQPGTLARSTFRQYQNTIRLFMEYASDGRYGWPKQCEDHFNSAPVQICDEWNTSEHTDEYEGRPERRPLTFDEIQALFDHLDSRFRDIKISKRKGSLAAARDAVMLKVVYAYGLRRREATRLTITDFHSNPKVKQFGRFGSLHVRYGKAVKGSEPRRRMVLTVPEFDWVVDLIENYISEIRPRFEPGKHPALFPTERAGYIHPVNLSLKYREIIEEAGLPEDLDLHSLRHSYSTHLAEFGYDPHFIQTQLGHSYAATTSIYTHVSNDFKNRQITDALQRLYERKEPS